MKKLFRQFAFFGAALFSLTPWMSPLLAIALGAALSLTIKNPYPKVGRKLAEWVLELSVVLLGLTMSLSTILNAMEQGALFAFAIISGSLLVGLLLGRVLGIGLRESALISAGSAICGSAAITAVGSAVHAEEEDITVAIGTVLVLNTAALYLFPVVGRAMHLNQQQFGIWAGVSIHDISSVVAAAESYGANAMPVAVAVKLTRVFWIIPLAFTLRWVVSRWGAKQAFPELRSKGAFRNQPPVPWFIGIFLMACATRQFLPGVLSAGPILTRWGVAGLTLTFFLMGAGISRKAVKSLGWRALTQGSLLWLFISLVSLFVILNWMEGGRVHA